MATLIALSLIKKKPSSTITTSPRALPSPKQYSPVQGDNATSIASRFGTSFQALQTANGVTRLPISQGKTVKLPPNVADLGKRPGAMGAAL